MKKIVSLLIVAIVIISCGAVSSGKKQVSLVNTKWILEDKSIMNKIPTLDVEANRVTGNGGCNRYFSDVVMNMVGGKLIFPDSLDLNIPKVYDGACIALVFPK